ncbi:hypothetical protein EMGBS1_04590 [Chloroflexota bacterium]|nr:hypothetical protein EMGBS1_04590 [Chloroflexota bacterium]
MSPGKCGTQMIQQVRHGYKQNGDTVGKALRGNRCRQMRFAAAVSAMQQQPAARAGCVALRQLHCAPHTLALARVCSVALRQKVVK